MCCRSDMTNADDDKTDDKDDDLVKGFKVANFEIIESPDKGNKLSTARLLLAAIHAAICHVIRARICGDKQLRHV